MCLYLVYVSERCVCVCVCAFYLLMISHFAYGISLCYLRFLSYSALCNANETNVASAAPPPPSPRLPAHLVRPETGAKLLTALVVDFPHFARFTPQ